MRGVSVESPRPNEPRPLELASTVGRRGEGGVEGEAPSSTLPVVAGEASPSETETASDGDSEAGFPRWKWNFKLCTMSVTKVSVLECREWRRRRECRREPEEHFPLRKMRLKAFL